MSGIDLTPDQQKTVEAHLALFGTVFIKLTLQGDLEVVPPWRITIDTNTRTPT